MKSMWIKAAEFGLSNIHFVCKITIDGLAQGCSNSNALKMELLQSCTELSIYRCVQRWCPNRDLVVGIYSYCIIYLIFYLS